MMHDTDLPRITRRHYQQQAQLARKAANDDDGSFDSCSLKGKAWAFAALAFGALTWLAALAYFIPRIF